MKPYPVSTSNPLVIRWLWSSWMREAATGNTWRWAALDKGDTDAD